MTHTNADRQPPVVDALLELCGDALRGVGEFQEDDYQLLYMRDDVSAQYSTEELDRIWRDMILESLRRQPLEGQFVAGGDYLFSAIGFEESVVFLVSHARGEGLVFSMDWGYFPRLSEAIETVHELTGP